MKKSSLSFQKKLPRLSQLDSFGQGENLFLIYDRYLEKNLPMTASWIRQFPFRYGVFSGERLKDLESFPDHLKKISSLAKDLSARRMTIVVLGGGSVGDFGGFVASIYKRGVRLIHVPSTWLAAVDTSHGGKTALNVGRVKNQVGTFYPAAEIFLVQELLCSQPEIRAHEAFSEVYKAALLRGGTFWSQFSNKSPSGAVLWKFLPQAIQTKYLIVAKDPLEKSGHRHLLNFGHTLGHVFETLFEIPHGIAVNYRIRFALDWGIHRGLSKRSFATDFLLSPAADGLLQKKYHKKIKELLSSDKKKTSQKAIRFVFCRRPGDFKIEEVTIDKIMREIDRQGQVRA